MWVFGLLLFVVGTTAYGIFAWIYWAVTGHVPSDWGGWIVFVAGASLGGSILDSVDFPWQGRETITELKAEIKKLSAAVDAIDSKLNRLKTDFDEFVNAKAGR